jgi:hypothetical protein
VSSVFCRRTLNSAGNAESSTAPAPLSLFARLSLLCCLPGAVVVRVNGLPVEDIPARRAPCPGGSK